MKNVLTIAILMALSPFAFADPTQNCASDIVACTQQNQNMGDTDNSSSADQSTSLSNQSNPSSNSNQSGNAINTGYDNSSQNSSNTKGEITGTITGGNTSSGASASGNKLDSDNRSSAHTGNNANHNQSSVGPTNSNSGGNVLGNDSSNTLLGGDTTAIAAGGAGGKGGQGGQGGKGGAATGGTSLAGALSGSLSGVKDSGNSAATAGVAGSGNSTMDRSGNADVSNTNGQQQGIDRSGNSTSTNLLGQTTDTRIGDVGSKSAAGALSGSALTVGDTKLTTGPSLSGSASKSSIGDQTSTNVNGLSNDGSGNSRNDVANTVGQGQGQSNDGSGNSTNEIGVSNTLGQDQSSVNTLSNGSNSGGNTMTGGANTSTSRGSADASGNSTVNIDASDRRSDTHSYRSTALALPTIHTAAPSFVASSNIVAERSACGPRVEKRSERVTGVLGKLSVDLGADDDLTPAAEPYRYWTSPRGSQHVFGHQTVTYAASNSVASSRSFGLGGNNAGLAGGQIGASSNSAATRTVLRIIVQECELQMEVRPLRVLSAEENG